MSEMGFEMLTGEMRASAKSNANKGAQFIIGIAEYQTRKNVSLSMMLSLVASYHALLAGLHDLGRQLDCEYLDNVYQCWPGITDVYVKVARVKGYGKHVLLTLISGAKA